MRKTRFNRCVICVMVAFALIFASTSFTPVPTTVAAASTWDGSSIDTDWWDADPTATSFSIGTAAEFAGMLKLSKEGEDFTGKTITLTSDIAFNYAKAGGNTFAGILDGENYILKSRGTDSLFATVTGTIKNLGIEVTGPGLDGAFAETLQSTGVITNCALRGIAVSTVNWGGGFVHDCYGKILKSYVTGTGIIHGHLAITAHEGSVFANCYSDFKEGFLVDCAVSTNSVNANIKKGDMFNCYANVLIRSSSYGSNSSGSYSWFFNSIVNCVYISRLYPSDSYFEATVSSNNYGESTSTGGSNIRKADMTPAFWQNTMDFDPDIWSYTTPYGYPKLKDVPDFGSSSSGGAGNIVIPPSIIDRSDYYVFPTGGDDDLQNTSYIDMLNEVVVVPESITMGAYSVDGGRTWKKGSPTDDKSTPPINGYRGGYISKYLNKGGALVIAEGFNSKTNSPTGKQVKFPHIEARPETDKVTANYTFLHTDIQGKLTFDVSSYNCWTVSTKDGKAITGEIMFAETTGGKSSSSQAVVSGQWKSLGNGVVVESSTTNKSTKYLVATAPIVTATKIVPKSKVSNVTVKPLGKAPKMKYQKKLGTYKFNSAVAVTILKDGTTTVTVVDKGGTLTLADGESIIAYVALPTAKTPASVVVTLAG